jgi:ABC-type bacteriocin/lantibiotic exporter with double-glycine peptidase domain
MGIIMLLIIILRTFIGSMKSILALKTGQRIDASLILGYYKHLLTLPQQFFDNMRVGEISSRVNDAVKIRVFINNVSLDLVVSLLILLFTVGLMLVYSWKLAVITLLSAPLFILIYFLFNRLNKKYQRKIMESGADLEAHLVESLNSVSTIKRFGIEIFANLKTEVRFVNLLRNTYRSIYGSIVANKGETTAIVGESGSGKTTLVSLLQHLYPIQSGSIHTGKYNIAQISNESLRQMVGSVPQQIELFAGNIVENIALGDPDIKKITDLSEQLGISEFIEKLPNAYMTTVGEHGATLSGGERQRIAIARVV